MLSGGLTHFCCGDPNFHPIPYDLRVQGECALVAWEGEAQGHPVIYQRTFCGDEEYDWEREGQALEKAFAFVRDNYELRFTDSFWRWEAEREQRKEEEPLWAKAFLWTLEALLSIDQKLNQIFKD